MLVEEDVTRGAWRSIDRSIGRRWRGRTKGEATGGGGGGREGEGGGGRGGGGRAIRGRFDDLAPFLGRRVAAGRGEWRMGGTRRWWRRWSPVMLLPLLLCAAVSLAACQFDATWNTAALDDDYDEIRRGYVADYRGIEESVLGSGNRREERGARDLDPRDPFYERIGAYRRNRAIDSRY